MWHGHTSPVKTINGYITLFKNNMWAFVVLAQYCSLQVCLTNLHCTNTNVNWIKSCKVQ